MARDRCRVPGKNSGRRSPIPAGSWNRYASGATAPGWRRSGPMSPGLASHGFLTPKIAGQEAGRGHSVNDGRPAASSETAGSGHHAKTPGRAAPAAGEKPQVEGPGFHHTGDLPQQVGRRSRDCSFSACFESGIMSIHGGLRSPVGAGLGGNQHGIFPAHPR